MSPNTSQTLKFKPSRAKWILLGIMFILLAGGFALMYAYTPRQEPPDDSLLVIGLLVAFFAAGAVLSFPNLLPGRVYLLLMPNGFAVRTLLKSRELRWEEVEEFRALSFKGTTMVVFTLSPQGKLRYTESGLRKLNKAVTGGDDSLPDTYGMSAEALADLMTQWKNRAQQR
jgi:hypothetical protein